MIAELFTKLETDLKADSRELLFEDRAPVWIYGAGNAGKDVLRLLQSRRVEVRGFLDLAAKPDSPGSNIPVRLPDDPVIGALEREQAHVVIGIFNAFVEVPPIIKLLKSLGYGRVTTFLELHDQFAEDLGDRYWLTSRKRYQALKGQASKGYELWADDASRELYANILQFRFSMDYERLPSPDLDNQYFAGDVPPWPTPLRLLDCGAFDGDTVRALVASKTQLEALAAFEPDAHNFTKLAQCVRANASKMPETVCLFPCGVDSSTRQIRFSSGHGSGSHASAEGDAMMQCVALDEALPTFRPNLIKMDIEGAEYDALLGARELIHRHRPGLAICVYHRPEDLWAIPQLVDDWKLDYRLFLRSHCYSGFDLVLYALPVD